MTRLNIPSSVRLRSWLSESFEPLSSEDKHQVADILAHADLRGLEFEVIWWAYVRRKDEDFNLIQCLNEGLLEWDIG